MIRTLIVEDSPVEQELLAHILTMDSAIEVVGIVANGEDALEATASLRPDVITMDIHMPKMNGYETTRQIMETHPVPIVIVSGSFVSNDMDRAPWKQVRWPSLENPGDRGIPITKRRPKP